MRKSFAVQRQRRGIRGGSSTSYRRTDEQGYPKVKRASAETLKSFSVMELVKIIDQAIDRLLDRNTPCRQKAEKLLPIVTGYSEELIRLGLTSYLKTFENTNCNVFLLRI
ncbi:hypothetical protein AAAC51_36080 [Priestia megaterium]